MKKNALLFSAGNYLDSKSFRKSDLDLTGVKYDVKSVEKRLNQIGLSVSVQQDAKKDDVLRLAAELASQSISDTVNIIYFSGHGGHSAGMDYIYPVDFGILYDQSCRVDEAGINILDIISLFKNKGVLILILDACRSDFDGVSKGYFSEMTSAENVYIAYGTMFQDTARATQNRVSPFTEAVCDEILAPNISVDELFTRVRQNIFRKYCIQIPVSVTGLLDKVCLKVIDNIDDIDRQVHNFVQTYGNQYCEKYGYFHGDDLIFIDAAQYFGISLLDAIWKFRKVEDSIYSARGVNLPQLSETESKIVSFLSFQRGSKFFTYDVSHTWYYNGRQIRMGEIPPLPPSMQRQLPEAGKEIIIDFSVDKIDDNIIIKTNIPNGCELFIYDNVRKFAPEYMVETGEIRIDKAKEITKITIESGIFSDNPDALDLLGVKLRNIAGKCVEYHPINGNQVKVNFTF